MHLEKIKRLTIWYGESSTQPPPLANGSTSMHVNQLFVCLYNHNIRIMLLQFHFITITLSSLMYFSEFLDQLLPLSSSLPRRLIVNAFLRPAISKDGSGLDFVYIEMDLDISDILFPPRFHLRYGSGSNSDGNRF